jgi:cold shock CspA family protein
MQVPVQVSFRGIPVSDDIEAACLREAEKLERYAQRITSCRVVVSAPHHHHVSGNLYEIKIDVTIPGIEIVVSRIPPEHKKNEKIALALREAFDTARRRLEDAVRKQSGAVKAHGTPAHGRIARLSPEQDHGFIESSDGRDVYFHANSVSKGGIGRLEVGTQVRFVEEQGINGPQATTVKCVGKRHHLSSRAP